MAFSLAIRAPYPVRTKKALGLVNEVDTEVGVSKFLDRIVITVRQAGRLAQWVQVPLEGPKPDTSAGIREHDDLLPLPHLTPRSLLGATDPERDHYGQLLAVQVATILSNRFPEETRVLLLGLGIEKPSTENDALLDMLNLVGQAL